MQKWNFQGGLFVNNNTVIVQKCYAMKRIAFLIFSCDDDEFLGQLDPLLKKMIEVFKQRQKDNNRGDIKQRLFLFFLTRVMLIRLNFQTLTEQLRKLWPHLLNELISVFEVKLDASSIVQGAKTDTLVPCLDKENTDLTIEAIKLVELLSSLNIEDFQQNQWIFLIDGYGMKLEQEGAAEASLSTSPSKTASTSKKLQEEQEKQARMKAVSAQDQEAFKTFIVRFIGDQSFSFYNVDKPQEGTDQEALDSYFLDQ
jgi:hypothetical protein